MTMNYPSNKRYILRVHTGLVLLVVSAGLFFIELPITLIQSIENHQKVLICQEEIRYLQREYNRQREESEALNREVVQASRQIQELVSSSNRNSKDINRLMDHALTSKESRDSIALLYDEQVGIIEPRIDSLQQRFSLLTDQMVTVLQSLYRQEKELNTCKLEQNSYSFTAAVWKVTFTVILIFLILLVSLGIRYTTHGFRMLKEETGSTEYSG